MESRHQGSDEPIIDGRTKNLYWIESLPPDREFRLNRVWTKAEAFGMWTHHGEATKFLADLRRELRDPANTTTAFDLRGMNIEHHLFRVAGQSLKDASRDDDVCRALAVS